MTQSRDDSGSGPYRSAVLEHNRAPHRRGRLARASGCGEGRNALCGDQVRIELALRQGRIVDYAFEAEACAIVIATASMLGDALIGADLAQVQRIDAGLRQLLESSAAADAAAEDELLGELAELAEMRALPRRHRCVTLSLEAVEQALAQAETRG